MLSRVRYGLTVVLSCLIPLFHSADVRADNQLGIAGDQTNWEQFDVGAVNSAGLSSAGNSQGGEDGSGLGSSGATGEQSHNTSIQQKRLNNSNSDTRLSLAQTYFGDIASRSVNPMPVSSGVFSFGFTGGAPSSARSMLLPPTSTSSCDFDIVDP